MKKKTTLYMGNHKETYLTERTALLIKHTLACLRQSSWGCTEKLVGSVHMATCGHFLSPPPPHSLGN